MPRATRIRAGKNGRYWGSTLPALLLAFGCEGKQRDYDFLNEPATSRFGNQGTAGSTATPGATPASAGEIAAPVGLAVDGADDGQTSSGGAVCVGDAGLCVPNLTCSGDAGTVCEATCPGCFVAGECIAVGALDPNNQCRVCDVERNPLGWSPRVGAACDDQLFCTIDDTCSVNGACQGSPRECEDGVVCNGTSTCNEQTESCTPDSNQCGSNAVCDARSDSCVSTCEGCLIAGVCVAEGTEAQGNPCLVCDVALSSVAYSAAVGKSCGAVATSCSAQDTCDGQGRCQPNHLAPGISCGNPSSSACDQPDTCDGNGNCQQRLAANGAPCDDGVFCTTGDQCQGGQCVASGVQNCGFNRFCNESTDECQCQGCQVGNACLAAGAANPSNPCQVCDPTRSAFAFSANTGARCGSPATTCSEQDTCDPQGNCRPNDSPEGTTCDDGQFCTIGDRCQAGQCAPTGRRICDVGQFCNETSNQCQCLGCLGIGGCYGAGAENPVNQCESCDPSTCNADGLCVPRPDADGTRCVSSVLPGGSCQRGQCIGCSGCFIDGVCFATGSRNPLNQCEVCDPTRAVTLWSADPACA
jgi:hypothetical protein